MQHNKKTNKGHHLTFMIVPHGSSKRVVSFRLKRSTVLIVCGLITVSLVLAASSLIYAAALSRKLVNYKMTLAANQSQKSRLAYFSMEASQFRKAIKNLSEREDELRRLLGLKNKKETTGFYSVIVSKERQRLDEKTGLKSGMVYGDFKRAEVDLAKSEKSLVDLQKMVSRIRKRFSETPSIWPIHGQIVSGFGYRYFPWRGFHTGVDISGWYGMPVRVTADGVVSFVGWKNGYGRTVMVKHDQGISTLYAHNSKVRVILGQKVSKGDVIAYVGSSGFSTGPHVHYEVRKNNKPINPKAYLGLDIFSASKVWH